MLKMLEAKQYESHSKTINKFAVESGWLYEFYMSGRANEATVNFIPDDYAPHVIQYREKAEIKYEMEILDRLSAYVQNSEDNHDSLSISDMKKFIEEEKSRIGQAFNRAVLPSLKNHDNDNSVKITIK